MCTQCCGGRRGRSCPAPPACTRPARPSCPAQRPCPAAPSAGRRCVLLAPLGRPRVRAAARVRRAADGRPGVWPEKGGWLGACVHGRLWPMPGRGKGRAGVLLLADASRGICSCLQLQHSTCSTCAGARSGAGAECARCSTALLPLCPCSHILLFLPSQFSSWTWRSAPWAPAAPSPSCPATATCASWLRRCQRATPTARWALGGRGAAGHSTLQLGIARCSRPPRCDALHCSINPSTDP